MSFKLFCKYVLKFLFFVIGFYVVSSFVAFLLKDDANAYSRVMMHEFYNQEKIDILSCGASHTSHGMNPNVANEITGKKTFCCGTASQKIDGTYAILQEAVNRYKLEKVLVELDFGIADKPGFKERTGLASEYIVSSYLRNPKIKLEYLLNCSAPKFYVNSFLLPIGKYKMLDLNPKKRIEKLKSIFSGAYFRYEYYSDDSEYAGKGCVLNYDVVENGSFQNTHPEPPINVGGIPKDYTDTLKKIAELCERNCQMLWIEV